MKIVWAFFHILLVSNDLMIMGKGTASSSKTKYVIGVGLLEYGML